jgi:uncharacterized protein YecT (DUF1311 family)
MTRFLKIGPVCAALAAVLVFVLTASAKAESVPASFDCRKAVSIVEKFICSRAALRWQDLALSRLYRAARAAVAGSARDDLLAGQRDWVRERDRRCIADRTFKELSGPSTELRDQAYDCLKTTYLGRRRTLQDLAAAPLSPRGIGAIDLKPIAAARPEIAEGGAVRVAGIRLSPDGALAAILLPSLELDGPDQVWLYRIADGRLVAASPAPDQQQPHPDGSPMAINATAWQGDMLYARVAIWSRDSESEEGASAVYAATIEGRTRLEEVPADIAALLDGEGEPAGIGQDEMTASDGESPEAIRGNRDFLAWADDLGHGTIELKTRKRAAGSPAYLAAWGSWGLWSYLFDTRRSLLVYSGDTGITVFDMATRGERRIAGTSQGDQPYAVSDDSGLIVWSTRNTCGAEFMTEQDEDAPERFCFAHLPQPEGSQ